jgi:hypothetical protein
MTLKHLEETSEFDDEHHELIRKFRYILHAGADNKPTERVVLKFADGFSGSFTREGDQDFRSELVGVYGHTIPMQNAFEHRMNSKGELYREELALCPKTDHSRQFVNSYINHLLNL